MYNVIVNSKIQIMLGCIGKWCGMVSTAGEKIIRSTCAMCYGACPILVHVKDGVVVKIEGDPTFPQTEGRICGKGASGMMVLYDPNRVKTPLKRTNPEKGIGVDPKWVPISWEEAMDIIVEKLKKIREDDPSRLHTCFWPFTSPGFLPTYLWAVAFGAMVNMGPWGAFCGGPAHVISMHAHMGFKDIADIDNSEYVIMFGTNIGCLANGAAMVNTVKYSDVRAEGKKKIVVIDPRMNTLANHAYRWLPMIPGTELAFFLALCYCIVYEIRKFDEEFLKKYTNAPYLIDSRGHYIRDVVSGKPLIWDSSDGKAKPFDDTTIKDFALEGEYEVNGVKCKPAFQVFKEHIKEYTPEWAEKITGVPAKTIREVAQELVEHARIGETREVEGKILPYRPVGLSVYSGAYGHSNAHLLNIAYLILCELLGCLDALGGTIAFNFTGFETGNKPSGFFPGKDGIHQAGYVPPPELPKYPFRRFYSEFLMTWWPSLIAWYVLTDPAGFGLKYRPEDCVLFLYSHNPMATGWNPKQVEELFKRWGFVIDITTHLDESAQFADIVLPDVTYLERLAVTGWNADTNPDPHWGVSITQPCVKPLYQSKNGIEVLLEIAERLGFAKDWFKLINQFALHAYPIEIDQKHTWEEICDHICRNATRNMGKEIGLEELKEIGWVYERYPIEAKYRPYYYRGFRARFYFDIITEHRDYIEQALPEFWDKLPDKAKELIKKILESHFLFPTWEPCAALKCSQEHPEYDLHAITYKTPLTTFSRTARNPVLMEVKERDATFLKIQIHELTARERGIKEGDIIVVESECGKIEGVAHLTKCIHPKVVAIPGVYGLWANPLKKDDKLHYNTLIPFSLGYVEYLTGGFEHHVAVKVYKKQEAST